MGSRRLTGSSLEALPRCCPLLKVLYLQQLPNLRSGFLSALRELMVGFVHGMHGLSGIVLQRELNCMGTTL